MATFERYFIAEKETHVEKKNPYYYLIENEQVMDSILVEFGLDIKGAHIVNGHVPVKQKNGENPIKCNGKVLVIDGGFSKAYQKETGIAGYTLIYNSYGLLLVAHEPFESTEAAIEKESDIHSESRLVQRAVMRRLVGELIYNSYGLLLVAHEPFESTEAAIEKESDIHSESRLVQRAVMRRLVGDTDAGKELREQIADLEKLLEAYRSGRIVEKL